MKNFPQLLTAMAALSVAQAHGATAEAPWWNKEWTQRQQVHLKTGAEGAGLTASAGTATILVRLSDANFTFAGAREDGGDLRFIAADGKTMLPHQLESYDGLLNEAFVWVKLPEAKAGSDELLYLYSGNPAAPPAAGSAQDDETVAVYHFAGRGEPPADAGTHGNHAATAGPTAEGSLIGAGLSLTGGTAITIPASPTLAWRAGQPLTVAVWIKPAALQQNAVILSRTAGTTSFRLLLDQGVPTFEIATPAGKVRGVAGAPVDAGAWTHLALVADGSNLRLFVNGDASSTTPGTLPAIDSPVLLGAADSGLIGELDEFSIADVARSDSWIKLAAVNQGNTDAAQRTLTVGATEGGAAGEQSHLLEHLSLFGDIAGNMMFDGWIAIGVCAVMIIVGWTVAIRKFVYLNAIEKGTRVFLRQWKSLSTDLTALDTGDVSSVSTLGGKAAGDDQRLITRSPLFHIYQIGAEEIRHRLDKDGNRIHGLSGRSIQAIRASLDAGLVHETHRLNNGLVYLTMSIAGGPYVGLLGTVVGVMITFAIIARSGEVNVNSIAPGIASALLATVVGLVVAIPALFIYSYLNGRIKNSLGLMQVFIDEFVAKMAEFHRPPAGAEDSVGGGH